jgi:polar amino acid transport system permease protein
MNWGLVFTSENLTRLLIGNYARTGEPGGLVLTLIIGTIGIIFSTIIGTLLGIMRSSPNRIIRWPAVVYIEFLRNIPLLILIFWAYFIPPYFGLDISRFLSVSIAIVIFNSAYIAEIVRAGLKSVHYTLQEAGSALGLSGVQVYTWVLLPQAFRNMIPALTGRYITVIKNTSLGFLIGLTDLTGIGRQINASLLTAPIEVYFTLLVTYFFINRALSAVTRSLEDKRRFNKLFIRL